MRSKIGEKKHLPSFESLKFELEATFCITANAPRRRSLMKFLQLFLVGSKF